MTVRHILKEEYDEANEIKYLAFGRKADVPKNDADDPNVIWPEIIVSCDEQGAIAARARNIEYTVCFDGHKVKMTGFSGVASRPECRGRGQVRELVRFANREDRQNGAVFSALYPFSHSFYARFGYALCADQYRASLPMSALSSFARMGGFYAKRHSLADGFADLRTVQQTGLASYNLAQLLTDRQFEKALGGDAYLHGDYRYILYNELDQPVAWFYFTDRESETNCVMDIHAIEWIDKEHLFQIFSFIHGFAARYDKVNLPLPTDVPLLSLLPEPKDIVLSRVPNGMARVLNPEQALRLMRHPDGSGAYSICLKDDFLVENTGVYNVQFEHGAVAVQKTDAGSADLVCDIRAFTQLILGYLSLDDMIDSETLTVIGNQTLLQRVFIRRPTYLPHHF